jgi:uncharacterized phiE125 gp8 family phage protein
MSVPLSTIKAALKIEYADDDTELLRLRDAATSLIARETGLVLQPEDKPLYLAYWRPTAVPHVPFVSVKSVKYYTGGVETTMPAIDYWLDRTDGPLPVLRFIETPAIDSDTQITATIESGYTQLPNEIVHAIISLTGAWYNNPEAFQPIGLNMVPMSVQFILESLRVREMIR